MIKKLPPKAKERNIVTVRKLKEIPVYFMACEGRTEISYFQELKTYLFGQNIEIALKFVNRTFSEQELTNPQQLVNLILDEKENADYKEITVEKIIRIVDNWMRENKIIQDYHIQKNAAEIIIKRMSLRHHFKNDIIHFKDIENGTMDFLFADLDFCIKHVLQQYISEFSIDDFKDYLNNRLSSLGYEKGDSVCVVCDRDFYDPEIYDIALNQCIKNGIGFYPTNPCFEFWILLHFDEFVDTIDSIREKIHKNDFEIDLETNKKERATFFEIKKYIPDYTKTRIQFDQYIDKVQNAINNEKMFFTEDEAELKTELGSRVGVLVSELLAPSKNCQI